MAIKNFFKAIGIILLYMFLSILASSIHIFLGIKNELATNIFMVLEALAVSLTLAHILKDKLKGQWADFKKNIKKYIKVALSHWGIGYLFMIITNAFIVYQILGGIAPNEAANRELLDNYLLYSVISMCFITPFTEEIVFRLNFKDTFKNKYVYTIVTGLIFAALHVVLSLTSTLDLLYIIPYFALGAAFSHAYFKTKNIYTSILAHTLHNTLSVIVLLLGI